MKIDTVLVAMNTEGDHDSLIDAALAVARPTGASVIVGTVHTEGTFESAVEGFDGETSPTAFARRSQAVQDAVERFENAGVPCDVRGEVGDPGELFVSMAEEVGADLLFIQEQKRSPTGKALFGSAAQTALLNASCSVTFVRQ